MGEHASASREFDKSLRTLREPLMIATEATPSGNPGDAALHHPASGFQEEASLGGLGGRFGLDRLGIGAGPQTAGGWDVPAELLFDPLKKLAPVMTISPNQGKPGKASSQSLKQLLACRQVRSTGCCHLDFHQVALAINQQVPFAPPDFLAHVDAFLRSPEQRWF